LFNPAESIDFQGNTGPFIQYTHARIRSILRKAAENGIQLLPPSENIELHSLEVELIVQLSNFPTTIDKAASDFAPSVVASYCYDLAKTFNSFYAELSVMNESNAEVRNFRLQLSKSIAETLRTGMKLLGIDVPERM
jgi:arginyl-tRNA synthetase